MDERLSRRTLLGGSLAASTAIMLGTGAAVAQPAPAETEGNAMSQDWN